MALLALAVIVLKYLSLGIVAKIAFITKVVMIVIF